MKVFTLNERTEKDVFDMKIQTVRVVVDRVCRGKKQTVEEERKSMKKEREKKRSA